jgi:hypothetical protein
MWQDVQKYVKGCITCQKAKPLSGKTANPLNPLPVPGAPWEVMSWDLIGPLPESCTYNAIVTIIDIQTKAIKLEPVNVTILVMRAAVIMRDQVY